VKMPPEPGGIFYFCADAATPRSPVSSRH